jgi:catechol 2,3-dioxygenase-like lactoylglutathione lyase family enzyme
LFKKGATTQAATTPGGIVPGHHGAGELHLALAIAADALEPWRAQLADQEVPVESEVTWPRGGVSLYFRDPDGHLLELATPGLWTIR